MTFTCWLNGNAGRTALVEAEDDIEAASAFRPAGSAHSLGPGWELFVWVRPERSHDAVCVVLTDHGSAYLPTGARLQ